MGVVYSKKKEYNNAIDAYKKAIEINPKNDDAYNIIWELFMVTKKEYSEAIEVNPKNNDIFLAPKF